MIRGRIRKKFAALENCCTAVQNGDMPNSSDTSTENVSRAESRWRRETARWTTIGALAVALPAIAGFGARVWWIFELASHFRVQYFGCLLVASVILVALGRWRTAGLTGAFCMLHGALLWPFYAPNHPSAAGRANLRIVSLNLNIANRKHAQVLRFIRDESPDVAVFLEVSERWGEVLKALEQEWPYSCTRPQYGSFGVALYSRLPLEESRIEFLSDGFPAVVARVNVAHNDDHIPVTIFGTHPMRPMWGLGVTPRDEQLAALAERIRQCPGPKIVVGDLNTTSWSPAFVDFRERTELCDSRSGRGVQPSWPAFLPRPFRIPIDHCLVSPGIRIIDRRIGPKVGSDHLPVIAELAIVPRAAE